LATTQSVIDRVHELAEQQHAEYLDDEGFPKLDMIPGGNISLESDDESYTGDDVSLANEDLYNSIIDSGESTDDSDDDWEPVDDESDENWESEDEDVSDSGDEDSSYAHEDESSIGDINNNETLSIPEQTINADMAEDEAPQGEPRSDNDGDEIQDEENPPPAGTKEREYSARTKERGNST